MTRQARIRRLQDTLSIAGGAVLAFGVWSIVKIILFLSFANEDALGWLLDDNGISLTVTVYALLGAIFLIDLAVRMYVGLSARAEGRGKKKNPFYLVVAFVAAISNAISLVAISLSTSFATSPLNMIVSIAIEATAIAALALVIYSSIRLRRMGKTTG